MHEAHYPVMLQESLDALAIRPDGRYVDGTFGRGGHSRAILERLRPEGRLLAIDQDPEAVAAGRASIQDPRFEIEHGSFAQLEAFARARDWQGAVNGILLDLGVSSPQLDTPERGFSFLREGPLDMRMNPTTGLSALQWLQQVDERALADVIRRYGEERFAGRIARAIKETLAAGALQTTLDLANVVSAAVPRKEAHKHPATRTFQAIRIAVNGELDALEAVLEQAERVLAPGGRLVVISFHSLEDRLVKRFIREHSRARDLYPDSPVPVAYSTPTLRAIGKAHFPSEAECAQNIRSRSAVMRVAEKI